MPPRRLSSPLGLAARLGRRGLGARAVVSLAALLLVGGCGGEGPGPSQVSAKRGPALAKRATALPQRPLPPPVAEVAATPAERVASFAPVVLTADVSGLPEKERAALDKVIEAARHLDPIFDLQAWEGNPALAQTLAADRTAEGQARLELFTIMRGPWDRQRHHEPFATEGARPPGAGFYPEDLSADDFRAWIAAHPKDRAAFESLTTVIRRRGEELVAVPYSEAYAEHLKPAAAALREAAGLTQNPSLRTFLRSRAKALLSDDYYRSDKDGWTSTRRSS